MKPNRINHPCALVLSTLVILLGAVITISAQTVDDFDPRVSGEVKSMAVQSDGKIVVAGYFDKLGDVYKSNLGRVNRDGTVDTEFYASVDNFVYSISIQPDGKIILGGDFTTVRGSTKPFLARLLPDGTLDTSFSPYLNHNVQSVVVLPDKKILVGGQFSNGRMGVARLNENGTLDTNFNAGTAMTTVLNIVPQSDGKYLLWGSNFKRVNSDGAADSSFVPFSTLNWGQAFVIQPDGHIWAGGSFNEQYCKFLTQFDSGGARSSSINLGIYDHIYSLAAQADGQVIVGWARGVKRMKTDQTWDSTFDVSANGRVSGVALQADGKILVGGAFTNIAGQVRRGMARLNNPNVATESLAFDNTGVTWVRGGSSPEVWRTSFEYTTGTNWTVLGPGTRTGGAWYLGGVSIPQNAIVRARGFTFGAFGTRSGWYVEKNSKALFIAEQPASRTNTPHTTATFAAGAFGEQPLGYQWYKDGFPMTNSGHISGALSSTLRIDYVLGANSGSYSVVVTNFSGSLTSRVATLTVLDPYIHQEPLSRTNNAGSKVIFSTQTDGTSPFGYCWLKDGFALTEAGGTTGVNTPNLTINEVYGNDAGNYCLMVSNSCGVVTSRPAELKVVDPFISSHPISKTNDSGQAAEMKVEARGTALSYQWRKDGVDLDGQTASVLCLPEIARAERGDYDVVVTSSFGSVTSSNAHLHINLFVADGFNSGLTGAVHAIAIQPDTRILVGGNFTQVAGQFRSYMARLNSQGDLDLDFNPRANASVKCMLLQPDGKIVVGGEFTEIGGQPLQYIGRLNTNGSLDTTFVANAGGPVTALGLQRDGKILVGGSFTTFNNEDHFFVCRLNTNGNVDPGFNVGADGPVLQFAVQPDDMILVGGDFAQLSGEQHFNIGRLAPDGSVDSSFTPSINGPVHALALQVDGRIIVGGVFTRVFSQVRRYISRLENNGFPDLSFTGSADSAVEAIAVQANGDILVGGAFTSLCEEPRAYIGRLHADGSVDMDVDKGANKPVLCLAIQPDGRILAGGQFTVLQGKNRQVIGRLSNTDPAIQTLSQEASAIRWLRGCTTPEIGYAIFERSLGNSEWIPLGAGERIDGGWQLTGVTLPSGTRIRARGFGTIGLLVQQQLPEEPLKMLLESGSYGFQAGRFGFHLDGSFGQVVVFEGSTDLVNWVSLKTNALGFGPYYFNDFASTNLQRRFYRGRLR